MTCQMSCMATDEDVHTAHTRLEQESYCILSRNFSEKMLLVMYARFNEFGVLESACTGTRAGGHSGDHLLGRKERPLERSSNAVSGV